MRGLIGYVYRASVACDSSNDIYGVNIPRSLHVGSAPFVRSHLMVGFATRCMHDMCWFPPARAYVISALIDEAAINRLNRSDSNCKTSLLQPITEKSFLITFLASKDDKHIQRGFENSLRYAGVSEDNINKFVNIIKGVTLRKGDTLQISCIPSESLIFLKLNSCDVSTNVTIKDCQSLIEGLHKLYLGAGASPDKEWISGARYLSIARSIAVQLESMENH